MDRKLKENIKTIYEQKEIINKNRNYRKEPTRYSGAEKYSN